MGTGGPHFHGEPKFSKKREIRQMFRIKASKTASPQEFELSEK